MNNYHQIYTLCVFVISFQVTDGENNYADTYDVYVHDDPNGNNDCGDGYYGGSDDGLLGLGDGIFGLDNGFLDDVYVDPPPPGYKYMPMSEVLANNDPDTYTIMPYGEVFGSAGQINNYGGDLKKRRKRGFFPISNPFASDVKKNTVTTVTATTGAATATATKVKSDVKTPLATDSATVKSVQDSVVPNDATKSTVGTVADKLNEIDIVDIGKDVESSMVVSAAYLPVVQKVATFIVPTMSPYQALTLSVNVATISSQAVHKYVQSDKVATVATTKTTETLLSKRDTGGIRQYANNVYDSLLNIFQSRFGHGPKTITETDSVEKIANVKIPEMDNNMKNVETIVKTKYVDGDVIPETETIVMENGAEIKHQIINKQIPAEPANKIQKTFNRNLGDKILDMKNKIKSSESTDNSESADNDTDEDDTDISDDSDDFDDSNKSDPVKINQGQFDEFVKKTMSLQPDEIKNLNDEELVKYIEDYKLQFPVDPKIDSTDIFSVLINSMKFNGNVTNEKRSYLIKMIGKTTNYFIDQEKIKIKQKTQK